MPRSWKLGASRLSAKAGFRPCGPEPSCGYVTETSRPDVELVNVYAAAAQRRTRSLRTVSASLELCPSAKSGMWAGC